MKKIGTTAKGIGPAYADYRQRKIVRVEDVVNPDNFQRVNQHMIARLKTYARNFDVSKEMEEHKFDLQSEMVKYYHAVKWLRDSIKIVDMNKKVRSLLDSNLPILAEGAQGVMLDITHGDFPNVTSSNTCGFGVFNGLGVGPHDFGALYGVTKPYVTKVGGGHFVCEMEQAHGQLFQRDGHERGASTGRPRKCGYPDILLWRHAIQMHRGFGPMRIIMSKTDIFPEELLGKPFYAITGHKDKNGNISKELQLPLTDDMQAVRVEIPSWKTPYDLRVYDETKCRDFDNFVDFMHRELSDLQKGSFVIDMVGTGPQVGQYFDYPVRY